MDSYRTTFRLCPEYMLLFDDDGRITDASDFAKLDSGFMEELLSMDIATLLPLIFVDGKTPEQCVELGRKLTTFLYRKNQTCFSAECVFFRLEGQEGDGYGCFLKDISQLTALKKKELETREELQAALRVKSEFVANVTHELKTPVNGIKGLVENLMDTELTPSQVETINVIRRCSNNMTKIINDLLDYAKLDAGKITLERREFSLHKLIRETLAFHAVQIGERGLKLISHIDRNIPEIIIGDELRLSQVMNNLLANAVKFTSVGSITFEVAMTERAEQEVELMFIVSDTGIGISKEERERLFQRFTQVDGSVTRRFGGTGLGLSISKELVSMMGGSIQLESEKGKGSTFSFSVRVGLPQTAKEPSAEGENETSQRLLSSDGMPDQREQGDVISPEEEKKELKSDFEKLVLCAELCSWEKAENFVLLIGRRIEKFYKDLEKPVFKLEMAVRREETDRILVLVEELKRQVEERENGTKG